MITMTDPCARPGEQPGMPSPGLGPRAQLAEVIGAKQEIPPLDLAQPDPAVAGACQGVDPELFFGPADSPEGGPMLAWELTALVVCQRCPVVEACLQAALEFPAAEQHGVIGV